MGLALITGVAGQDGSYLAEQLLTAGQRVVGLVHPHESLPAYLTQVGGHSLCELIPCDIADPGAFRRLLRVLGPSRVFHLAAVSSPVACQENPTYSAKVNVTSVEALIEWLSRDSTGSRALVCSSAAVFGNQGGKCSERTPPSPLNEYGRQKQVVRELAMQAREGGLFVACAVPFNHESPRRPEEFVVAKVCQSAARIARGRQERLVLGDLEARRDWGYAPEYVTAMAWMLDVDRPVELVLATGKDHSVEELVAAALGRVGLDPQRCVVSDSALKRADDPAVLIGDPSQAWLELGWEARTSFEELVGIMVDAALAALR